MMYVLLLLGCECELFIISIASHEYHVRLDPCVSILPPMGCDFMLMISVDPWS